MEKYNIRDDAYERDIVCVYVFSAFAFLPENHIVQLLVLTHPPPRLGRYKRHFHLLQQLHQLTLHIGHAKRIFHNTRYMRR